jgi:ATP-dependent Clp protease ATP-binding subunit ClpA
MAQATRIGKRRLDPEVKGEAALEFEAGLRSCVVGQDRAVRSLVGLYQVFRSGLTAANRPIGTMLFMGPTGSGKTRVVEAAAETLFGDAQAMIKIDCAEYQHSHEIAKLVGSPPGYLGHRETPPLLAQENLTRYQTHKDPITLILFDEIEKASDSLWQLLLGVIDKATLTLGDNRRVDFSQTVIFMTSNLGAKEISRLDSASMGFAPAPANSSGGDVQDRKIYRTAVEAARRKFTPEFMNRIDKIVVFRRLSKQCLRQVLDLELNILQRRIVQNKDARFTFSLSDAAKQLLLDEGTNEQYGARHLKRSIERLLVGSIANLISTRQIGPGDELFVDCDRARRKLLFFRGEVPAETHTACSEALPAARAGLDQGCVAA